MVPVPAQASRIPRDCSPLRCKYTARVLETFGVVTDAGNAGVSPSELVDGVFGAAASAGGVSGIVGVVVEVPVVETEPAEESSHVRNRLSFFFR